MHVHVMNEAALAILGSSFAVLFVLASMIFQKVKPKFTSAYILITVVCSLAINAAIFILVLQQIKFTIE